jgi:lysosomal acid lipase/cholesteryl ester hydrolase
MIDYVLKKTGKKTLTYMGHSHGTTVMFYALTKNFKEIRSKVNLFLAFAPVTNISTT